MIFEYLLGFKWMRALKKKHIVWSFSIRSQYASVHLTLGVHFGFFNSLWAQLYTIFSLWKVLYQTAHTSVQVLLHYYHYNSWKIFAMKFKLGTYTTPITPSAPGYAHFWVCCITREKESQVCTCQTQQSDPPSYHAFLCFANQLVSFSFAKACANKFLVLKIKFPFRSLPKPREIGQFMNLEKRHCSSFFWILLWINKSKIDSNCFWISLNCGDARDIDTSSRT